VAGARHLRPAVAVTVAALLWACPGGAAALPLTLGFDAYPPLGSPTAAGTAWLGRAAREGAQVVRIGVRWAAVAPAARPPGFVPEDPAAPGYSWSATDAAIRATTRAGLQPLLEIYGAPAWAQDGTPPTSATAGAWRPDATQFGAFALASARRYSGRYPDPLTAGATLPRVRLWGAWNEPNLSISLAPQWVSAGRRLVPASPGIYRRLLNAFYAAVKRVSHANTVIAGATAPFGDPEPGGARIQPITFVRDLLCLRADLRSAGCGDPAHFDVLDHHPYSIAGPLQQAIDPGDVSVPDIGKLTRLLRAARRARTIVPDTPKRVFATELAWVSRPPDPAGTPVAQQALWLEQSLFLLWRQGVDTVLWLQIRDDARSAADALGAGVFYASGVPKPAALAFRFPFVATRAGEPAGEVLVWGRAPAAGPLLIERRAGRGWAGVRALRVRAQAVFSAVLQIGPGPATLRARVGATTSLPWPQSR
jgi:hypothetical protein